MAATTAQRRRRWGANLRAELDCRNLTVSEFRDRLRDEQGVTLHVESIYEWLRGETSPKAENQLAIVKVLDVRPEDLFPLDVEVA